MKDKKSLILISLLGILFLISFLPFENDASSGKPERIAPKTVQTTTKTSTKKKPDKAKKRISIKDKDSSNLPMNSSQLVLLSGTLVVEDSDDNEHTSENGTIFLRPWSKEQGSTLPVPVEQGEWSIEVPIDTNVSIMKVELGGREASVRGFYIPKIHEDKHVDIKATWIYDTLLHVVDKETGADLTGVEVVKHFWQETPEESQHHPGTYAKPIIKNGNSPLEIKADKKTDSYRVRATGYSWQVIKVHHKGLTRRVELEKGGNLKVKFINSQSVDKYIVILPKAQKNPYKKRTMLNLKKESEFSLKGLWPGKYAVFVKAGNIYDHTSTLASQEIEIKAGETTNVELTLANVPDFGEKVKATGRIIFPGDIKDFPAISGIRLGPINKDLKIQQKSKGLNRNSMKEESFDTLKWESSPILPGKYRLQIFEYNYLTEVEVMPDGNCKPDCLLPELMDIKVFVYDELGSEVSDAHVHLAFQHQGSVSGSGVRYNREKACYTFRLTPSQNVNFYISVNKGGYKYVHKKIDAVNPPETIEVELKKFNDLILTCTIDGVPVDWQEQQKIYKNLRVRKVGADGHAIKVPGSLLTLKDEGEFEFYFEGGDYTLSEPFTFEFPRENLKLKLKVKKLNK